MAKGGVSGVKEGARRAARGARSWIEGMARLGYAAWRLFQGVLDPDGEGREAKGLI